MKLTVLERMMILNSIKEEGDILFLRTRGELIKKVGIQDAEIEKYDFKIDPVDGTAKWNPNVPQEADIDLSDIQRGIIKDALIRLNREGKLITQHISLYEKFVEGGK